MSSQERIVRYEANRVRAEFLADSGLEWAKYSLSKDVDWEGGTKTFQGGRVEVEVIKNPQGFRVISRSESEKTIQIRYGDFINENNTLVLKSYGVLNE